MRAQLDLLEWLVAHPPAACEERRQSQGPMLLYRVDAGRNMARFYALAVEPTLFGEWALVKRWGRIGQEGSSRSEAFASAADAASALARQQGRKIRRGYRVS